MIGHARSALLGWLVAAALSCASTRPPMEALFQEAAQDFGETRDLLGLDGEAAERHEKRLARARRASATEDFASASEFLFAAALLATSRSIADLVLAERLAMRAGILGDERGRPLSGEILDKQLWLEGEPQRYGTQVVYDKRERRWRLWDVDPRTSDEDRRVMGLPDLEALTARAAVVEERLGEWMRRKQEVGE